MQRRVLVALCHADAVELAADAGRLVYRQLLRDREVQRQVEEGIDVAALGLPVPIEMALGVFEDRVILGVLRDEAGGDPLEAGREAPARGAFSTPRSGSGAPRRVTD